MDKGYGNLAASIGSTMKSYTSSTLIVFNSSKGSIFLECFRLVKETVFPPLYNFASFVKDKMAKGAWIYLWTFYFVPLIYISIFVPVSYCLDDGSFVV